MSLFNYRNIRKISYPTLKSEYGNKLIFSIICRTFSTIVAILFNKIKFSPNLVSIFSIILGCLGIYKLFMGDYLTGALLVAFCKFLDCVDGELARITKIFSQKSGLLEPLNSDLQYLFLVPSISFGLIRDSQIELLYLFLSVIAAGGFVSIRKLWNLKIWIGQTNLSFIKSLFFCQFKPSGKLRSINRIGAFFYYLKYNLLAQNGIMYPVLIFISYYNQNWLIYYIQYFIFVYISFFLLTFFGYLFIPKSMFSYNSK